MVNSLLKLAIRKILLWKPQLSIPEQSYKLKDEDYISIWVSRKWGGIVFGGVYNKLYNYSVYNNL